MVAMAMARNGLGHGSEGGSLLWDWMQHPAFDFPSYYSIYTRTKDVNGFYVKLLSWQGMRNILRKMLCEGWNCILEP